MRFLGIGDYNDLAAMYHGLAARGHEVRVFVEDPACHDVFGGMLQRVDDWRAELDWLRAAGASGIALFESATEGLAQDELRRDGFQVIGGSALGDRLEADREFGQQVLRASGLQTAHSHSFTAYGDAIAFLQREGGRYVLKFNGADSPRTRNYIGELDDGADMLALLAMYRDHAPPGANPDFVLMEHLQGVEVGVGAYFNGEAFLDTACIDFEHKRFFSGELGELTGEMGTIVSYRGSRRLFDAALAPLAGLLREGGYCGYINVNLIANEAGLWPLEFTSRFGYPGFAICEALHAEPWEDIFMRMLRRDSLHLHTRGGFAAGVVLTVPPFPYRQGYAELSKGEPICFRPQMSAAEREAVHFAEVATVRGQLVTSGASGYIGVATGTGGSVRQARDHAYQVARQVVIPNLRYRTDIGDRVISRDLLMLVALGWLDADVPGQGGGVRPG
ncbi:MAG: phosphoribosylamine--glycine ligase [Pseudomonadota bacterium]|uniref:phosphoribosylglycinamide synthetase C domain-containing protein n=1 Tax=Polaromonas sp. TaxID=1869339 RepID=UPI0017A38C39|nr:phosphoribosylglycinamide synthetase C domain-containing protein [Polaromonas sp.]MBA3595115.1 phosphoribosylamine--glycine ligase [Polaromonas sp.]MDQ3272290.1 phosphoribosylamine--glycine ligase [Pseudomonadota bacterium]